MPYTLNGAAADIDEEPEDRDGTVYVPFAKITRALGGTVAWDNESKAATGTIGQWTAKFTEASDAADVNGTHVTFSAPAFVDNDELYVPADFFQAAYGYKVTANGTDVTIAV